MADTELEQRMMVNPFDRDGSENSLHSQKIEQTESLLDPKVEDVIRVYKDRKNLEHGRDFKWDAVPYLTPEQINSVLINIISREDCRYGQDYARVYVLLRKLIHESHENEVLAGKKPSFFLTPGDYQIFALKGLHTRAAPATRISLTVDGSVANLGAHCYNCDFIIHGDVGYLEGPQYDCDFTIYGKISDWWGICKTSRGKHEKVEDFTIRTTDRTAFNSIYNLTANIVNVKAYLINANGETLEDNIR